MFKRKLIAAAVALAFTGPALAQDAELGKIREEIRQMKDAYEKRIQELEKRLSAAEAKAGKAETAATKAESTAGKAEQNAATAEAATASLASARSGENAFNPALSLILQGTYANTSQDPNTYQITGFVPSGGEVGPPKRSFGLGETELNISANIDPYFRGVAIASLAPEGRGQRRGGVLPDARAVARLYAQRRAFFFRHRLPERAAPARVGFSGRAARVQGVSRQPVEAGRRAVEVGRADGSFHGSGRRGQRRRPVSRQRPKQERHRRQRVFANLGGDIGASTAWRAGVSYLQMSPNGRSYQDVDSAGNPTTNTFTGTAKMWGTQRCAEMGAKR